MRELNWIAPGRVTRERRQLVLTASVLAMLAIFGLRLLVLEAEQDSIFFLMVIPIAIVAIQVGIRWGLAMALLAQALFVLWTVLEGADITVVGHVVRLVTYVGIASIAGYLALRLMRIEAKAANSERLAQELVQHSTDAMLIKDVGGRYLMANRTLTRMFGVTEAELLGRTDREVFPSELADRVEAEDRRVLESPDPVTFERAVDTPDGLSRTLQTTKGLVRDPRGRPIALYAVGRDISERKHEEDLFRALVSRAPDAMVVSDAGGQIILANARAEEMLGYVTGSLVGKSIDELVPQRLRERHAHHRENFARAPKAREMGSDLGPLAVVRSDGSELPVEISLAPLTAGNDLLVSASIRDVSERMADERRVEAQLEATKVLAEERDVETAVARLLASVRGTLGWTSLSWWRSDVPEGTETDALSRALPMRRVTLDAAAGEGEVVAKLEPEAMSEHPRSEPAWVTHDGEAGGQAGGTAVWAPVWIGDELVGGLQMIDAQAREREPGLLELLLAIGGQLGHFVQSREAEIESERVKNEFFAVISHELRTPLTSIIGYADLLEELDAERLSDDGRHALGVVQRNATRELRLVRDLLFLVRLQSDRFEVHLDEADVAAAVLDAVEGQRPVADASGIDLVADLSELPPTPVDRERITQVADNLISNALKFTQRGGNVHVRLFEQEGMARLEVRDDGQGIPADELEHLFERMYRARNAERMHVPGLGLGLTIVTAITEAHGGHAWIESEEGVGTTAIVELPLQQRAPVEVAVAQKEKVR